TLPFWQHLLPTLKTLIIVRNPLEVACSMRQRNGTSYAFGLRLWEIYNRRAIETSKDQERFVTHYDFFFENAKTELRRITQFIGLPDRKINKAAGLVTKQRRHTHFTIDQLVDARVSEEVIELYRALINEADRGASPSPKKRNKRKTPAVKRTGKLGEAYLLPGAVSLINTSVPERENVRFVQIENLEHEIGQLRVHLVRREGRFFKMQKTAARQDGRIAKMQ